MASTRNNNTPGNYCHQQKQYAHNEQYTLYPNSQYGSAYNTRIPGNGVNPGQVPWNQLSYNPVEIESSLFGINSTNLVNPQPEVKPELRTLETANFFEKGPVLMPDPLVIEKNQRPFPSP
jgi:hypothetical protein|tara:strand:- start:2123 stop:2482 length:360 start_codon:yes stop_codon:yes gene_type:complete